MFALSIATTSLLIILSMCFTVLYLSMPNNLLELIIGFVMFLSFTTIGGIKKFKKYKKEHKLVIEEKKRLIYNLNKDDIKDILIASLLKYEIFKNEIYNIVSVLKITEIEKRKITQDIIDSFDDYIEKRNKTS